MPRMVGPRAIRILGAPSDFYRMALGNFSDGRMPNGRKDLYEFGPFRLDVAERQLFRDGAPVPLTIKAFEVLHLLVRNSDRTVTKEEFMSEVWAETVVEEGNLTDNISTLRQALADDAREPKYIRTVPKRGYRFVAEVRSSSTPVESAAQTVAPPPRRKRFAPIAIAALVLIVIATIVMLVLSRRDAVTATDARTLAVLPFKPLVAADRDPAMEMGMTDALIAKLSRVRGISVRPTTAVMPYIETASDLRAIAAKLDVESILDGKLQKSGDRVRVSVQLVRAADGVTVWADRFDERFTDIFALQDAISERVAAALEVRLTSSDRQSLAKRSTDNIEAYQLYLNGIHQWRTFTTEGLLASVNYHQAALKLEPDFALAWAGLSKSYNVIGIWGPLPAREAFPKSQEAARKAVALDPSSPETHVPVAAVKLFYERDWNGAQRELDTIAQLDGAHSDLHTLRGYYFQAMGRPVEALAELQLARAAAPDWRITQNDVLDALLEARRYDEAIAACREAIALDPAPSTPHAILGNALTIQGQHKEAIERLEHAVARTKRENSRHLASLARAYAKSGRRDTALALLQEVQGKRDPWMPISAANVHVALGDHDQAFLWLNRAADEKFAFLWDVRNRPEFDDIRGDARYAKLLRRIGLSP